ncbi:MAG TPA: hypothetical protein VMB25_20700 [Bryobacteraceae bacterium]|nr:hypothetical protein [Bryobacteraceae bacterium]
MSSSEEASRQTLSSWLFDEGTFLSIKVTSPGGLWFEAKGNLSEFDDKVILFSGIGGWTLGVKFDSPLTLLSETNLGGSEGGVTVKVASESVTCLLTGPAPSTSLLPS